MNNKLYVGNLAYTINDSDLFEQFTSHGDVRSAKVMMDRDSGRSKGFGFVEMASDEAAQAAIRALDGKSIGGRALTVNVARPREERPAGFGASRGGFGGNRGGSGYGGGYGGNRSSH